MKYQKHLEPKLSLVFKKRTTEEKVILTKMKIISFIKYHNRRPSVHATDEVERSLGSKLRNYINPSTKSFDPIFTDQINKVDHYVKDKAEKLINRHLSEVEGFITKHGRRPTATKNTKKWNEEDEKSLTLKLSHLKYTHNLNVYQKERLGKILSSPSKRDLNKLKIK